MSEKPIWMPDWNNPDLLEKWKQFSSDLNKPTTMKDEIKQGSLTDKGLVEKIVYLTFSPGGWPTGSYSDSPIPDGKGLVCAKIGNKNIPVGELKIIKS